MGFLDHGSITRQHQVTVLTDGFQIQCTLHAIGTVQLYLNDEQKGTLTLHDVTAYGLERGNPATSVAVSELHIRKDAVHAILFEEKLSQNEAGLLPRKTPLAAYTSQYVLQGNFHLGPEDRIADFLQVAKSAFVGATDMSIFPLFDAKTALVQQAPMIFLHRNTVKFHHEV